MIRFRFLKVRAFWLGFFEHLSISDLGRTWTDLDLTEAYDRGWNLADRITFRSQED